jgi:hypothetical protein
LEPSSTHAAGLQRRQFGRRDTSRSAVATLPGRPPVACTVLNLSEGGALIQFGSAAVPDRNFRLVLDDAPFTLICEVRHQNADRIGVRFLNHADGVRLMAHLFPGPDLSGEPLETRPVADAPAMPVVTNRALRQQVLGSIAERTRAAEAEAAAVKPAEPLRQRLQEGLRSAFSAFGREGHAEPAPGPASNGQPEPTASPVAKPSIWPDEPLNYQPKRSRKNGIKGKSAGGIG